MSYTVTATKMRPAVFDQLAGQDFVATSLKKSVESGKVAHAYLFSGPRGCGKTSAARILAKAINCQNPDKDGNPCCKCSSCLEIAKGNSLDVIEIDGASNTSVNDVRQIKDEVLFAPANSKYKVYIIDEVHMLSNSAFNALLKTIEEPPPYIVFIFATTEVYKVPATIRSRCQHFNFRLVHPEIVKGLLRRVCDENGIKAADDVLFWIAKESTGSLRDAYTLFDKVAAFSGDEISLDVIKEKMGLVGFDKINMLAECFAEGNSKWALDILDEILGNGVAAEQFVTELAEYLRNVLLIKNGVSKEAVLGYPVSAFSKKVIDIFTVCQVEQAFSLVLQLYRDLRYSLSQRFEIELLTVRLAGMKNFTTSRELVERLENLKKGFVPLASKTAAAPVQTNAENAAVRATESSPKPEAVAYDDPAAEERPSVDVNAVKKDVIAAIRKNGSIFVASALGKTGEWSEENGVVTIRCTDSFVASQMSDYEKTVTDALLEITGLSFRLKTVLESKKIEADPPKVVTAGSEKLNKIKDMFKGEIL